MSTTTSTREDVPPMVRRYAHTRKRKKTPAVRRTRTATPTMFRRSLPLVLPLTLFVVLLLAWYAVTAFGLVSSLLLPAPGDVFTSLIDATNVSFLLSSAFITIQESVAGFLVALVIALPLGYGLAKSRLLAWTLQPYLSAGQAIPAIIIAPLLTLWLGFVIGANILVCMLVVFFPIVINTVLGMRSIDPALTDAARVEGASGWSLLAHIEFPLALPAILAAIRIGFTLSITGALVGEFVNPNVQGLGVLLLQAKSQYNTPLMFAALVVLAVLAALYYAATGLLVKLADVIY